MNNFNFFKKTSQDNFQKYFSIEVISTKIFFRIFNILKHFLKYISKHCLKFFLIKRKYLKSDYKDKVIVKIYKEFQTSPLRCFQTCRYGFEGTLQAIYGYDREPLECDKKKDLFCTFEKPERVLQELDVEKAEFWLDFFLLWIIFLGLRIGCYIVLRCRVRSQ